MSSQDDFMNCSQDPNLSLSNSPALKYKRKAVVAQATEIYYINHQLSRSLIWGSINAAVFSIIFIDLFNQCPVPYELWQNVEYGFGVILFINTIYHICCYIYYFRVRRLNIVSDTSLAAPPKVEDTSLKANNTSLNITAFSFERSRRETSLNTSGNGFATPSQKESPNNVILSSSGSTPKSKSPGLGSVKTNKTVDSIKDEASLNQYLKDYTITDKFGETHYPYNESSGTTIWTHPASSEPQMVHLIRTHYQLSSTVTDENNANSSKDKISPLMKYGYMDFWKRRGANLNHVPQMCDHLRVWISSTILSRVVDEINVANEHFMKHGHSELRIGHTGIERLRKSVILHNGPNSFSTLIPFIDFSNYQEYVVHRIKELAKSRCMSDFRWNSGSLTFHGRSWDTHLPTDCAIIMHLLATYLDGQLVPLPQQPDGKPFTSQYLCTNVSEKPLNRPGIFKIHQTEINPPHYVLVTQEGIHEPAKGRNNLFHTLILFLLYIKTCCDGMLGRVSLGPAGVNILWIIDKRL